MSSPVTGLSLRITSRGVASDDWVGVDGELALTVSAGVATGDLSEVRLLVQRADAALLDAKRAGRDRVIVWTAAPSSAGR